MSEKSYAIKCTNCAAPLNVLGGGRVNTLTCEYCHSVLDLNNHYAVLSKFNDVKRPDGPFEIGMRGNIKGVVWTIIGWITYKTDEFPSEKWSEFFLYSPTHGYAWLVYEDGTISFSSKIRDFDIRQWQVDKPKTIFYHKGHYLRTEASYLCYIEYVEGELNWIAKFGDKITCWDYNGIRYQTLNIEQSNGELEVFHTQKLKPKDIYSAFNLEYTQTTQTTQEAIKSDAHDNPNVTVEEEVDFTSPNGGFLILFVLLSILALSSLFYSKTIYKNTYTNNFETSIKIDSSAFLTSIHLSVSGSGDADNKLWLYKDGKKIFYIDKAKVYFVKKEIRKSWSYKATAATIYLKLDKGNYRLVCHKNKNQTYTTIKIEQEVIRLKYLIPLLLIIALLLFTAYSHLFNTNVIMILFILIGIIIAYEIFGLQALAGLGLFAYFIYSGYTEYEGKDE